MKILVVDDDVEVVRWIGNAFTTLMEGYLMLTATTANQGLNFIKGEKPEVIIMDVRLGPVSGMDLLEDYTKHSKGYRPSMIVITAYEDEAAKKRAEALKVDAYLRKPFSRQELLAAILRAIRRQYELKIHSVDLVLKGLEATPKNVSGSHDFLEEKSRERKKDNPDQKD